MVSGTGEVALDGGAVDAFCCEVRFVALVFVARAVGGVVDCFMVGLLVVRGWSTPPSYH
jgi:hypothetical protein